MPRPPPRAAQPSAAIRRAPAATMGCKGLPLADTAEAPVTGGSYPGVVATRLPDRQQRA